MTHRLTTNCAKKYCNRTLIVKVIAENVVTCFLLGHSVESSSGNIPACSWPTPDQRPRTWLRGHLWMFQSDWRTKIRQC